MGNLVIVRRQDIVSTSIEKKENISFFEKKICCENENKRRNILLGIL